MSFFHGNNIDDDDDIGSSVTAQKNVLDAWVTLTVDKEINQTSVPIPGSVQKSSGAMGQHVSKWLNNIHKRFNDEEEEDEVDEQQRLEQEKDKQEEILSRNLREFQKRSIYGDLENPHLEQSAMSHPYKQFLFEQLDRVSTELPEPMLATLADDTLPILESMHLRYSKIIGDNKDVTRHTSERIEEMKRCLKVDEP